MSSDHNSTILITGGTGFAGSHLVELLLAEGFSSVHVTTFGAQDTFVHTLLPQDHIHHLDLTNFEATQNLLSSLQPQYIYHLAAFAKVAHSHKQALQIMSNNSSLQWNLLEAVRLVCPSTRILVVGSAQEYDFYAAQYQGLETINETVPLGPVNPYGVSKVDQDLLSLSYHYSYNLDIVRIRPFNHTGERQTADFAVPEFARQIIAVEQGKQSEIEVGNLSAVRDMSDVKDVVRAYLTLMQQGETGEVYNVGSGEGHSMQEILDQLISLSRANVTVTVDQSRFRPQDIPMIVADISKIKTLGWSPTLPLSQTLARVLEYWRHL